MTQAVSGCGGEDYLARTPTMYRIISVGRTCSQYSFHIVWQKDNESDTEPTNHDPMASWTTYMRKLIVL
jgi:hypothetical protein